MTNEEKEKMIKFLFPTEETRRFMCNDFYQEILKIIPINLCINEKHRDSNLRNENFILVKAKLKHFVLMDKVYNKEIFKHYYVTNFDNFIEKLVEGYVFYITMISSRHKKIDIFKDSRSICYKRFCFANIF